MVSQFGDFKLCDFGVSRFLDHTTNASQSGTPAYRAPEIAHMEKYGKSVDLYSLGIMMYWMLNNRKMPFIDADEGDDPAENEWSTAAALQRSSVCRCRRRGAIG